MSPTNPFSKYYQQKNTPLSHLPYIPKPQDNNQIPQFDLMNPSYSEIEDDIHTIAGLNFGSRKTNEYDEYGNSYLRNQKNSHILGSGRKVDDPDQVAGVCHFCEKDAYKDFKKRLRSPNITKSIHSRKCEI